MEITLETLPPGGTETAREEASRLEFKRVPALDKCFAILDLITRSARPLGLSEIARQLHFNKSTVFNIVHTLADLEVLEYGPHGKLAFGTRLYVLGKACANKAELVRTVRPYLEKMAHESALSSFLVVRWGLSAVIIDKAEADAEVRVAYETGARLPLLLGAGGKALLSQLSDAELDKILGESELREFASHARVDTTALKEAVAKVRQDGIAVDVEEHIKGVVALAVPIDTHRADLQAAILVAGVKWVSWDGDVFSASSLLKKIAGLVDSRFCTAAGCPSDAKLAQAERPLHRNKHLAIFADEPARGRGSKRAPTRGTSR